MNEHNINRERNMLAVLQAEPTEAHLWDAVCLFQGAVFKTYSGLEFTYELRRGRSGAYTKELWTNRSDCGKVKTTDKRMQAATVIQSHYTV